MDRRAAYAGVRRRVTELTTSLDEAASGTIAPATPEWTVKDIVAHLAGVVTDIRNGNLDGVGTDPWTAKQVADRRGKSLADCLAEWNEGAEHVEPTIPDFPPRATAQMVSDAWTHEQDIRGALRMPGGRDADAAAVALESFVAGLVARVAEQDLALRIRAGDREWSAGDAPEVTLTAGPFELPRAISGRRNAAQVRAYDWDGDPEPYLPVFSAFPMREDPLVE